MDDEGGVVCVCVEIDAGGGGASGESRAVAVGETRGSDRDTGVGTMHT